jgi:pyruvate/oxaloacetate carboxyltransferase
MGTSGQKYLTIEAVRKSVAVDLDSTIHVRSTTSVSTDPENAGPASDVLGVYLSIGPLSMSMSTAEAMNIALALMDTVAYYREKKAEALEHYEAMARNAQQGRA